MRKEKEGKCYMCGKETYLYYKSCEYSHPVFNAMCPGKRKIPMTQSRDIDNIENFVYPGEDVCFNT